MPLKNIICILLLVFGNVSCTFSQQGSITIIDVDIVKEEVIGKDVQWVDIRTSEEYEAGYIDDAINISIANKENFKLAFQKLNKEKPVYIYCYSGWRSHRAAKILIALGFAKVYDFKGGYKAWSE